MYDKPRFLPAGDQALVVELGDVVDPDLNRRVHNLTAAIQEAGVAGVIDLVPTYRSLLVYYDSLGTSMADLQKEIEGLEGALGEHPKERPRVVQVPTRYGGDHGPDLEFVVQHTGLAVEKVVSLHSGTDYLVYMMGFNTGFPYLGGLDERLATPRLETPRTEIPAGSVGIAEGQTGVYPMASPGGWRLIGRTPLKLFDAKREPPALLTAGDYIRFIPIATDEEYDDIDSLVRGGTYEVVVEAAV